MHFNTIKIYCNTVFHAFPLKESSLPIHEKSTLFFYFEYYSNRHLKYSFLIFKVGNGLIYQLAEHTRDSNHEGSNDAPSPN